MDLFVKTAIVILAICNVFCVFMLVKNEITCKHRLKICKAIDRYRNPELVDYDDMESYDDTLFRLWDWGYTRILPKEKYALIRHLMED